ncbi:MAG: thioredoxin fold domain-containing protein [Candidatus Marinimicrobia bacterium]|nr:thioredoxin fold domain-containing protein [Candidatus Neomarinimicrobiota bacterium]
MKQFFSVLMLTFLWVTFAFATEHEGWFEFDRGLELSSDQSKPVLIDFYTDWCHWCKVLDEKTFSDPVVKKYMDTHFIRIKVHAETNDDEQTYKGQTFTSAQLARAFRVTGYPALAFLDKNQEIVTLVPGFLPPEKFINVLKYIKEECYTTGISFQDYLDKGCNPPEQ